MRRAVGALGAALVAGCVSLPVPTALDVERARAAGTATSVEALIEGRRVYLSRCGGCHQHYSPETHSSREWRQMVEEMRERAKLGPEDEARILDYLVVFSAAGEDAGPAAAAAHSQRPSHSLTSHVLVSRMGGSGPALPALPARGPALASAQSPEEGPTAGERSASSRR